MKRTTLYALLAMLAATPATAQEPTALTDEAVAAIAAFYNRPSTTRLDGDTRIAASAEVAGDVASLGGPLTIAGTVAGEVVVINGDLVIEPGGRVMGAVTIAGGRFDGDSAAVTGPITVYPEALRVRREDGRIVAVEPARPSLISAGRSTWFGRTDLVVAIEDSYNRVEGLAVAFGPRVELGHSNPTVLDARLIYRTRSGLRVHPDEFGHDVRLEQYLGGHRALLLGLAKYSVIDPIDTNGLSDTENSLSTFVLHRDYRDHFERRGWSAYFRLIGRTRPYDAGVEYRDESHGSMASGTPWSLLRNDDPWRPQPQVAEGALRTVRGWFRWDTRNDRLDPSDGWLMDVEVEQGVEGDLRVLAPDGAPIPPGPDSLVPRSVDAEFTSLRVDARRYLRLGPRSRVSLRAFAAGAPDDGALPPQRQSVLGGEGSLPGYGRFRFDCGARGGGVAEDGFFPYYGCDRMVLFQAEYRFAFLTGESLGRRLGLDFDLVTTPELVVFGDAGRAWIEPESIGYRRGFGPDRFRFDAGVGLRLGPIGLYLAVPLTDSDDPVNFFLRLGPRI